MSRPWYIALLVVGIALLTASGIIAVLGGMPAWEQRILTAVNGMNVPGWVAAQLASPISNAMYGMLLLLGVLLLVPKFRLRAWQYMAAAGSAVVATFILEHIVTRARPGGTIQEVVVRASSDGWGFPSTHVAVVTALGLTIWPLVSWPWRVLIVCFIGAEAWSRLFLGVHAPLDVVGGFAVGAIVVAVLHLLPVKIRTFFRLSTT